MKVLSPWLHQFLDAPVAPEAIADACRESVRSTRYQLSAVQSICANTRYQAGLT